MMGDIIHSMTGKKLPLIICMFMLNAAMAQKAVITSVDVQNAGHEDVVTIQGHTFGTDASQLVVFFGAAKGTIKFVSDQLLEVKVPAGATYDKIAIVNKATGHIAYTNDNFLLTYGGEPGFDAADLEGQKDFNSESGLYDLCMCDFDGDNRNDIATANDNSNSFTVLANNTTVTTLAGISFNTQSRLLNARTIHATCGDLNGDGKPDLVIAEGGTVGDRLFIFQNTSTGPGNINFSVNAITLTGKKLKQLKIADLDLDGRPEVLVTNQSGNNITILVNESTAASISFAATPITIAVTGATNSDGLATDDLDGDGFPEVIINQFLTANSNVFIFKNTSTPGAVSLGPITTLPLGGTAVNIKVGDLDGDNKADIAVTQLLNASVSIFLNQSTSGSIAFSSPVPFATEERPWGLDFGDLDGDGKPDIAIASLTKKSITILNNQSSPGSLSFQRTTKATTFINRHIRISDVDGDGKPDIAFTSIDDNNNGIPASKISVFRNKACLKPEIGPEGPHNICAGFPLQLNASVSAGITYEWKDNGTTVSSGPDAFFDVTVPSGIHSYTVTAISEGGACSLTSDAVEVTINAGALSQAVAIPAIDPVCIGSTLTLGVDVNVPEVTQYKWTGPEGYAATGASPAPVNNFQQHNAGRYFLDVFVGSCIAQQLSVVVDGVALPSFEISTGGSGVVCPPDTKTLTIIPAPATFTYQWFETNSGIITGATGTNLSVPASGSYYVEAKYTANPACATVQTDPVQITFAAAPVPAFTIPATACRGENITFNNQSTFDASLTPVYLWKFGDGETASENTPVHKYNTASTFSVELTISYNGGGCSTTSAPKSITIQNAPPAVISSPGNVLSVCPGESLELQVAGTFTSYEWSTNETTPSIFISQGGLVSVDVTTPAGCRINATAEITELEKPEVTITADPADIAERESTQLTASGLDIYTWDADETLSSTTIPNPVATPVVNTTYRVSGTGANGCSGDAVIQVIVRAGSVYGKISPSKFFSPDNGDEIGKYWLVDKIEEFPYCEVFIYDEKGVQVYTAKPYLNNWDGTFKGQKLPDGVYYFMIKCEGEQNSPKTGSITILR